MKGNDILQAMAYIGADLVDEAEQRRFPKAAWRTWVGLAACLLVMAAMGLGARFLLREAAVSPDTVLSQSEEADPIPEDHVEPNEVPENSEYTPREPEERFWEVVIGPYVWELELPLTPLTSLEALDEAMGIVEDGQPMAGAVYYSTRWPPMEMAEGWPCELILEHEGNYYYAFTWGEKIKDPIYTYDEARSMTEEELLKAFASPMASCIQAVPVEYGGQTALSAMEQLLLFRGVFMVEVKAGVVTPGRWIAERQEDEIDAPPEYDVPAADIQKTLDRYFTGLKFDPRSLDCYNPESDTVRLDYYLMPNGSDTDPVSANLVNSVSSNLVSCQWDEANQTVQIQVELWHTVYGDDGCATEIIVGEKAYTIQFTEDGPKYLSIELVDGQ